MNSLLEEVCGKALALGVPLSAQLDLTYRCNQRCVHCYLVREDRPEMTAAEIRGVLEQLAQAGTLFLCLSGGEVLLREDFFEILAHARALRFNLRLKTNGTLLGPAEARRIRELGVGQVHVSVYSHRPAVHDGITRLPGSLEGSLAAIRRLTSEGVTTGVAFILMRGNVSDCDAVRALAADCGAGFSLDPTITPRLDGDASPTALGAPATALPDLLGRLGEEYAVRPSGPELGHSVPCAAGHTACYISPYGDVFPCVQFPLLCGNVLRQTFADIWRHSEALARIRRISLSDLPVCRGCPYLAGCTRCPGLAYMQGDPHGPSPLDCGKARALAAAG